MQKIALSRKPLLLLLFSLLHLHRHHTSCRHDVPNQQMQRSNQFGVEAAKTTAPMPTAMVRGWVLKIGLARAFTYQNHTSQPNQYHRHPPIQIDA
jgi:hypothetical protein